MWRRDAYLPAYHWLQPQQDSRLSRASTLAVMTVMTVMAVMAVMSGCTVKRSLSVEVRDRTTGQPIESAVVRIEALSFFMPVWPHSQPLPQRSAASQSDADGRARFASVSYPAVVYILSDAHLPLRIELDQPLAKLSGWLTDAEATALDGTTNLLEARFGP